MIDRLMMREFVVRCSTACSVDIAVRDIAILFAT
jgi:hypothetical protein